MSQHDSRGLTRTLHLYIHMTAADTVSATLCSICHRCWLQSFTTLHCQLFHRWHQRSSIVMWQLFALLNFTHRTDLKSNFVIQKTSQFSNQSYVLTDYFSHITTLTTRRRCIINAHCYHYCHYHSPYGLRGFFFRHDMTYASSSRSVEGFNVSKSISISSGLESFSAGSRACMINTIRPSLSPTQVHH